MRVFNITPIRVLFAILTFSVFAGDLFADALLDSTGIEAAQHSHEGCGGDGPCPDGPCPSCCAVHSGSAIVSNSIVQLEDLPPSLISFGAFLEHAPSGEPVSIKYPPRRS